MANILGSIMVLLGANTASFESGMNAASKTAQKTGKDIERAFEDLGSKAESILGGLGPIASQFSASLGGIGTTARSVLGELGPLAGALGPLGVAVASIAAVSVGAAVGLTGIAIHAAEADAKIGELSKSTGIAVESLSLLGDVASTKGIAMEQMATALERMARSAFMAAQAAPSARNAYTQLGIAVTDASGHMRAAQSIFNDVAQKFSTMSDGPQKTALAIQLFGRSGAALIPLLDEGGARIAALEGHFEKLGAVISGPLAAASEQLKENQSLLGAAFKGIENQIASALLPAINAVSEQFVSFFENNQDSIRTIVTVVADVAKAVLNLFQIIGENFYLLYQQFAILIDGIKGVGHVLADVASDIRHGDFKNVWGDIRNDSAAAAGDMAKHFEQAWGSIKNTGKSIGQVWSASLPAADKTSPFGDPAIERKPDKGADRAERIFEQLKAETDAQLALAAAADKSAAAQKLQQAAGEADQIIARMLEAAHGHLTAQLQQEIVAVHALTAERLIAKDAIAVDKELQKQIDASEEQIDASKRMAAAYLQGGDAILSAKIEQKLAPQIVAARNLRNEFIALKDAAEQYAAGTKNLGGAAGPVQGLNVSPDDLSKVKARVDKADSDLEKLRIDELAKARQEYQVEINNTAQALTNEQPLLDQLNAAYGQNAEAVRHALVALSLFHWEQAHPGATPEQIQAVSAQLEQQSIIQQRSADAQLAARYNIAKSYDDEIAKLERAKEVLQSYGQDTMGIDAAIFDERQKMLRQWDDAAFKVGDFHAKYQAVMNELVIEGQNAGEAIAKSFLGAITSAEDDLAKFMTGQKVQPQKIVQNLAEQVTKAELQKFTGEIAGHFGIKMPGLEGKPDGTAGNPLHVSVVNMPAPGSGGVSGGAVATPPFLAQSSTLQNIISLFGGARATGGSVASGKHYLVGEHGPEIFHASTSGEIVPNNKVRDLMAQGWTFNPRSSDANTVKYERYQRSLHQGPAGNTWQSLLGLAAPFLSKELHGLFSHSPTAASTATDAGRSSALPGSFGAGIGAGASSTPGFMLPALSGFMADGGDVFAGNSYMVGERGTELFAPGGMSSSGRGGDVYHGDVYHGPVVNQKIDGAGSSDLFKHTAKQKMSEMLRLLKS